MQVQSDKWCPIYPPPWKTPPSWNLSLRRELNRGIHKLATVVVRRWSHLLSRHVACTISLLRCVYGFDAYLAYSWNSKSKIRHNTLKPRCLPHYHTFDIPKGDQVSPFSSVIRLTWRRLLRWSADVCIELCNSFISRFCKVPPQLCDGSTVVHGICSSRVQGPVCFLYSVIKLNCIWRLLFDAVKLVVDGLRDRFYCVT